MCDTMASQHVLYTVGPRGDTDDMYKITISEELYDQATAVQKTLQSGDFHGFQGEFRKKIEDTYSLGKIRHHPYLAVAEDKMVVEICWDDGFRTVSGSYHDFELPDGPEKLVDNNESFSMYADLGDHPAVWFKEDLVKETFEPVDTGSRMRVEEFIDECVEDEHMDALLRKRELLAENLDYTLPEDEDMQQNTGTEGDID